MKITAIEATSHQISVQVPLFDEPLVRPLVFVRVETDAGLTGYGLTGPRQRFATRELWLADETIFHDPPKPSCGFVTLSDRPGLGLEPRLDVLKETREKA